MRAPPSVAFWSQRPWLCGSIRSNWVMPGSGISGPAMEASIFQEKVALSLTPMLVSRLQDFEGGAMNRLLAMAITAGAALSQETEESDFAVVSQRFEDGPAVVAMTDSARLALIRLAIRPRCSTASP
jgi:hypothetical protein